MRILVFGDSIAQGFWDIEGGWVARIRRHYDRQIIDDGATDLPTVINLGVSGHATSEVIDRIDSEIAARSSKGIEPVIILAVGVNDTQFYEDDFYSTPERYYEQLGTMLSLAQKHSNKILFVGLGYIVEERVQPMPWSETGKSYSNERVWQFEQTLRRFCEDNNVPIVKVYEKMQAEQQGRELMPDGVHPNSEGHQLIAELVLTEVDTLLKK